MARLAGELAPLGCLAVQMPDNEDEPTHVLMREIAAEPRFRDKLAGAAGARETIGSFADYDAALFPLCDEIDIWRTVYVHRLDGPDAIVAWVESAGLRPFLAPLGPEERAAFLARYRAAIAGAYPPRAGGGVLLPFPRLFDRRLATRRGARRGLTAPFAPSRHAGANRPGRRLVGSRLDREVAGANDAKRLSRFRPALPPRSSAPTRARSRRTRASLDPAPLPPLADPADPESAGQGTLRPRDDADRES